MTHWLQSIWDLDFAHYEILCVTQYITRNNNKSFVKSFCKYRSTNEHYIYIKRTVDLYCNIYNNFIQMIYHHLGP